MAVVKCSATDDKGQFDFKGGTRILLRGVKKPEYVYVLVVSDKFISYYTTPDSKTKRIVTRPMGEIIEISETKDIFAKDSGKETEKVTQCKKQMA